MSTKPAVRSPGSVVVPRQSAPLTLQAVQSSVAYHAVMLDGLKTGTVLWSTWDAGLGGTGRVSRAIRQCAAALAEWRDQLAAMQQHRPAS
jgi:hypothetical protein